MAAPFITPARSFTTYGYRLRQWEETQLGKFHDHALFMKGLDVSYIMRNREHKSPNFISNAPERFESLTVRLIAKTNNGNRDEKRLMIHTDSGGALLFGFLSDEDCSAAWDIWFQNIEDAIDDCLPEFGVEPSDWKEISDPLDGCQQDWIANIRVKGRDSGSPRFGEYEILTNGKWVDYHPASTASRSS